MLHISCLAGSTLVGLNWVCEFYHPTLLQQLGFVVLVLGLTVLDNFELINFGSVHPNMKLKVIVNDELVLRKLLSQTNFLRYVIYSQLILKAFLNELFYLIGGVLRVP